MGADDRADAAGDDIKGKAQEAVGKVTGDDSKVAEGKGNQAKSDVKNAVEDVKDDFKH